MAGNKQRLFFALWPDAALREGLAHLPVSIPKGKVESDNMHLTLVFIGAVDATTRACMEQAAATTRGKNFTLTLDHIGYWPKPRVLWLGPTLIPQPLLSLVDDLKTALAKNCGVTAESRPYRPHVTLSRKVHPDAPALEIEPLTWHAKSFSLVESRSEASGVKYLPLKTWDLE